MTIWLAKNAQRCGFLGPNPTNVALSCLQDKTLEVAKPSRPKRNTGILHFTQLAFNHRLKSTDDNYREYRKNSNTSP